MKLYIKNMVCDRCIIVVQQQLEALSYKVSNLKLGEVEISPDADSQALSIIQKEFSSVGFELIYQKRQKLVEQIKLLIIDKIKKENSENNVNVSDYLADKLDMDYFYLSHVFSEEEGITIEKFVIAKKIEKVKEYIRYGELSISEMAWKFGYSSVQALSGQFKKVVGITIGEYKKKLV